MVENNSRHNVRIRVPAVPVRSEEEMAGPRDGRGVTQVNEGTADERGVEALRVRNVESFLSVRARTRSSVPRSVSCALLSAVPARDTSLGMPASRCHDTVGVESKRLRC